MRRESFLWAWFGLVLLATLLVVGAGGWVPPRGDPDYLTYLGLWLLPGLFTGLGAVIATRHPGNLISRLFLAMGIAALIGDWADLNVPLVAPDPVSNLDALAVIFARAHYIVGLLVPFLLLMFVFPTGTFLTRRWFWAGWAAAVAASTALFAEALAKELSPLSLTGADAWTVQNPWGFLDPGGSGSPPYSLILAMTVVPLVIGGVAAMVMRYKRSSAIVRAQIRWVVYALCLFVFAVLISSLVDVYGLGLMISILLVPVSVVVAINRYKLFEIDRLISRTISYAIVVGLLALVFAAGVVWIPSTLGIDDNALLVAASTLAVAALFNPVRKRVLHRVDRRFNRSAYKAEGIVHEFSNRLSEALDTDELAELWMRTTNEALHPKVAGIWLNPESPRRPRH